MNLDRGGSGYVIAKIASAYWLILGAWDKKLNARKARSKYAPVSEFIKLLKTRGVYVCVGLRQLHV